MTEIKKRYNQRYVSYAIAHGERDPERMIEKDKAASPGGCMVNFINWNSSEWATWRELHPGEHTDPTSKEFTAWQRERAERVYAVLTKPEPEDDGEPMEFWGVTLEGLKMTSQSLRSLERWLDSRGPGEHLSESLREILAVLKDGGRVTCARLLDD